MYPPKPVYDLIHGVSSYKRLFNNLVPDIRCIFLDYLGTSTIMHIGVVS